MDVIRPYITNVLNSSAGKHALTAGIIGDHPSVYSKSPQVWNAAFANLHIDAIYVPFDVPADRLIGLIHELRDWPHFIGGNVTVPHKLAVMDLLDEIDLLAAQIGAVNTIKRTEDGKLIGYNTDADAAIASLLQIAPWQPRPLMETLKGKKALLIGAGGAGRAVAFGMAKLYGASGRLYIANRSFATAKVLADAINSTYGGAQAIGEDAIGDVIADVDVVINSSVKGQLGLRHLLDDQVTSLESYSSLAPASPEILKLTAENEESAMSHVWRESSDDDIQRNLAASMEAMAKAKEGAVFFDMIYAPLETPLLAQARQCGFPTLNGKGMNILQAARSFVGIVMHKHLLSAEWAQDEAYQVVSKSMAAAW